MKKKIFLDGPRDPRSTIKKKRWGSGDENAGASNLVPRGCVPFGQHQRSNTSGLINVKIQQIEI